MNLAGNPPAARITPSIVRRAAVTGGAVALVLVGERIPLPYVEADVLRPVLVGASARSSVSLLSLGLAPFISAFVLVELVALVVPWLRAVRLGSSSDRRPLTRAAWALAVVFAAVQGWGIASFLARLRGVRGEPVLEEGLGPAIGVVIALALATLALGCAAHLVTRFGLGNGYAVLIAIPAIENLLGFGRALLRSRSEYWTDAGRLAVLSAIVLFLVRLARPRTGGDGGPRVPVPTCGLAPITGSEFAVAFAVALSGWIHGADRFGTPFADREIYAYVRIAVTAALAVAFARAFCGTAAVVAAYRRAAPEPAGVIPEGVVRRALLGSDLRSIALVVGLGALPVIVALAGIPVAVRVDVVLNAAVVVAVALDLREEVGWRADRVPWVSAYPSHRVYAVEPAVLALRAAGIPAATRARRFRALSHFFAPYAPIELFVPSDRAAEARAICERVVAGARGPSSPARSEST
ncbi:MAG TPA: hypothetical protein VFK90_10365 [Anaeromyxobacter sp.]|nr:hypothetical protein [Anaeromyxobacter sp.]